MIKGGKMMSENEFYTIAFLKAFGKSPEVYADRESALLWQIASEKSVTEADCCYRRPNQEAALIAAESRKMLMNGMER